MGDRDQMMAQLESQYCPPLDSATFLAILSDYDVTITDELQAARQTLDSITEGLDEEEASGFDPSGSSGLERNSRYHGEEESESGRSMPAWSSNTDDTPLSQGMSALDLEGLEFSDSRGVTAEMQQQSTTSSDAYNAQLEGLDSSSIEAVLIETFPGLKPFDIKWTLKKCNGNAGQAIDDLLHQVFLEENGSRHRGVEGFSESDLPERPRKAKGKKKRSKLTSESSNTTEPSSSLDSKWDSARQDIEFLTLKTGMPMNQISSMYHANGASVPKTINAIIDAHLSLSMEPTDPVIDINAHDLNAAFPTILLPRATALIELTHPSITAANELAKALMVRPLRPKTPILIDIRLPPPALVPNQPMSKDTNAAFAIPVPVAPGDPDYIALRHVAFTQARAAHRAAKSNPLMGGAASYYSQLGRDYSSRIAAQSSSDADALVASQSSGSTLDLHGVNVKDAVRIAREGVTSWWASKRRLEPGMAFTGYKIITGKGTHSEGGRSKLGPAVGGMLIKEGWKVNVGSGALVVTGVVSKKG